MPTSLHTNCYPALWLSSTLASLMLFTPPGMRSPQSNHIPPAQGPLFCDSSCDLLQLFIPEQAEFSLFSIPVFISIIQATMVGLSTQGLRDYLAHPAFFTGELLRPEKVMWSVQDCTVSGGQSWSWQQLSLVHQAWKRKRNNYPHVYKNNIVFKLLFFL